MYLILEMDAPKKIIHRLLPVGPLQCNCSILACAATREAVVIDPGDEAEKIVSRLSEEGLRVKYLLHTHAHFDHVGGTGGVRKACGAPVCLHEGDRELYANVPLQARLFGMTAEEPPPVEKWLEDGERLAFGDYSVETLHTPGHSPGSVCFRVWGNGEELLFSGDTLFQRSIGRTDLWGGSLDQLLQSVRRRLWTLDDDTPVYPGHGPATRIGEEKAENPFL